MMGFAKYLFLLCLYMGMVQNWAPGKRHGVEKKTPPHLQIEEISILTPAMRWGKASRHDHWCHISVLLLKKPT